MEYYGVALRPADDGSEGGHQVVSQETLKGQEGHRVVSKEGHGVLKHHGSQEGHGVLNRHGS